MKNEIDLTDMAFGGNPDWMPRLVEVKHEQENPSKRVLEEGKTSVREVSDLDARKNSNQVS